MTNPGDAFMQMEFPAEVWLASEDIPLGRLLDLQSGDVLTLSKAPEAEVDLVVNGVTVASGELVVVDGSFGLRVSTTTTRKIAELENNGGGEELS